MGRSRVGGSSGGAASVFGFSITGKLSFPKPADILSLQMKHHWPRPLARDSLLIPPKGIQLVQFIIH